MVAYRTYPHVDMAETGARAAFVLAQLLDGMARPHCAVRRLPFLIPLTSQSTDLEPCRAIYQALGKTGVGAAAAACRSRPGFRLPTSPSAGRWSSPMARRPAPPKPPRRNWPGWSNSPRAHFDAPVYSADEAVKRAIAIADRSERPVVIADTQDNPGAGGDSDTTGMLRALLANGAGRLARGAALGLMVDVDAARAAHAAGPGHDITLALGGKSGIQGDAPLQGRFRVEALSDGRVLCKGPYARGATMELGLSACLSIDGVRVVLVSRKTQLADQELFRFVGIEPTTQAILVNKSSVHFRADFTSIAQQILVAKAPGPMIADPSEFAWTRLAPGIRLRPNGRAFQAANGGRT